MDASHKWLALKVQGEMKECGIRIEFEMHVTLVSYKIPPLFVTSLIGDLARQGYGPRHEEWWYLVTHELMSCRHFLRARRDTHKGDPLVAFHWDRCSQHALFLMECRRWVANALPEFQDLRDWEAMSNPKCRMDFAEFVDELIDV